MSRTLRAGTIGFMVFSFCCVRLAEAAAIAAASPANHATYVTPISVAILARLISSGARNLSFSHIFHLTLIFSIAWAVCLILTLSIGRSWGRRLHPVAFLLQAIILSPVAILGLASLPQDLHVFMTGKLDGEWLHEGWLVFEVLGLWVLFSFAMAVIGFRSRATAKDTREHGSSP